MWVEDEELYPEVDPDDELPIDDVEPEHDDSIAGDMESDLYDMRY